MSRLLRLLLASLVLVSATPPFAARADQGDCGQPLTQGEEPVASDALHVLRTSVGSEVCPLCICDVNLDSKIFATDSLLTLRKSVGSPVTLSCLECQPFAAGIELNPNPVRAGETLVTTIRITNSEAVEDATVTIELPASFAAFGTGATSGAPVTCGTNVTPSADICSPGETLTWSLGDVPLIPELYEPVLTMPAPIAAGQPNGTLVEIAAVVTAPAILPMTVEASVEIDSTANLDLSVSSNDEPVLPGSVVTWTVSFANRAGAPASTSTVLRVGLPEGASLLDATGGGVPGGNDDVVWEVGTLAAGQHGTRQLRLQLDESLESHLASTSTLENAEGEIATALILLGVRTDRDVVLAIQPGPDPVRPGETSVSLLHVTNVADFPLSNVEVEVFFPSELQDFIATIATGATALCTSNISASTGVCSPRERLVWNVGGIAEGNGVTLTLPAMIRAATAGGTLTTFEVRVRAADGVVAATRRSLRVATPDVLDLSVAAGADPALPGADLAYTLTFGNPSAVASSTGTMLTMKVPDGSSFVSATDGGSEDDGVVLWAIGALAIGDGGTRQAWFEVESTDGEVLRTEADLTSNEGAHERAGADVRTQADAPLTFEIGFTSTAVAVGGSVVMQMHVVNETGAQLSGVTLEVFLPGEVLAFSHANLGGLGASCGTNVSVSSTNCAPGELATWPIGNLAAGAEVARAMTAPLQAAIPAGTVVTFEARARASGGVHAALRGDVRIAD